MNDLIKKIEQGKTITINNISFDKTLLDELSIDLRGAYHIYKDEECRKFIHAYANYKKNFKEDIYSHNLLVAFIIGFAIGVFIAGIIALVEQIIIK